jgi:tetratricopeptide (TPR) repeat protein
MQMPLVTEIIDVTTLCTNCPRKLNNEIPRDNILHTINLMFEGDTELITVYGAEGIGKTTLLAQFARKHADRSLCLFVRPSSRFGYDPELLTFDLCNQMLWLLGKRDALTIADPVPLSRLIYDLQRSCSHKKPHYYFVIDGLNDIPPEDLHLRDQIVSGLPLGLTQFKFLCSSNTADLAIARLSKLPHSPLPLTPFTSGETATFLGGLDPELVDEFYRVSRGVPGYLASLKRMITAGTSAKQIIDRLPSSLPELFELEWKTVDSSNTLQIHALSILAHDRTKHSAQDLAFFLDATPSDVTNALKPLHFINIPQDQQEELSFASDALRHFAKLELAQYQEFATDCLISALLRSPLSQKSVASLPDYLGQARKHEELLAYLSPEHFARMLEQSQSIVPVRRHAELGLAAARELHNDADLIRFGIQEAAIADLDGFEVSHFEIEARMALGDHASALALAHAAVLKQDRLRLLAAFARAKREQGLSLEPEILQQIQLLLNEIDVRDLGNRAIDLAIDLMHVKTDAAIKVVERMANNPDGRSLDLALARLSIAGVFAKEKEEGESKRAAETARMKIKDPDLFKFSTALAFSVGRYSPEEILAEVEKVNSPLDRLFLLRQWASNTNKYDRSLELVKHAFELSLRTSEYTPSATHYRELATPLPYCDKTTELKELIGLFDSQKVRIEQLGPTEDYIRLQLLLAEAEATYDFTAATSRVVDTYLLTDRLPDLVTKAACLAFLISALSKIDPTKRLEASDQIHSLSRQELTKYVDQLLRDTAHQDFVVEGILNALALTNPEMATNIAQSMNIEIRRDSALATVVRAQLQAPPNMFPFDSCFATVNKISDSEAREDLLCDILERVTKSWPAEILAMYADKLLPFIQYATRLVDPVLRARSCGFAMSLIAESGTTAYRGLVESLTRTVEQAWRAIDDDWIRLDVGFEISSILVNHCRDVAATYLNEADEFRRTLPLYGCRTSYLMAVRLAIRAFSGLVASYVDTEDDYKRLEIHIDRIPSIRSRADLWSDVALRLFRDEKHAKAKRVVNDKLKPALSLLEKLNPAEWARMVTISAPAVYCSHKTLGLELIAKLPNDWIDLAYDETIEFLLDKQPSTEPYDGSERRYALTYEEAVDICELLKLVSTDWVIYRHVDFMVESLLWKKNYYSFTSEQKNNIIKQLEVVIDTRLPTPRFIQHDGFKIIAKAQVARLKKGAATEWPSITSAATQVPNLADRAMVTAVIAHCLPVLAEQEALFLVAKGLTEQIPSLLDRVDRLQIIAGECSDSDVTLCKATLREAMQLAGSQDDPEFDSLRKRIIDTAHRLSTELANSLVSALDDDQARKRVRQTAKKHLQVLTLRGRLADESENPDKILEAENNDFRGLRDAAWMTLGSLNANRVAPVKVSHTREYVQKAAKWPLRDAYPVLAWVIENANRKLRKTDAGSSILRGIYNATILGADLTARMVLRTSAKLQKISPIVPRGASDDSFVVRAGERGLVLRYLERWLSTKLSSYLKICDPFLGPEDVASILQMVLSSGNKVQVSFLTSRKHQQPSENFQELYRREWRRVSDQDPPDTQVVIVSARSTGDSPIHERWWLTENSGLRLGTSYNAIGLTKDSEITQMKMDELHDREVEINECIYGIKRIHNNERIEYISFSL